MEAKTPGWNRYASLDLWRGVAALLVVVYHSTFYVHANRAETLTGLAAGVYGVIGRMWAGVPLFFVISGYCIAAACDNVRDRPRNVSGYFLRRFRRIFPPYWVFFLTTAAVFVLLGLIGHRWLYQDEINHTPDPRLLTGWQWLGDLTLTERWRAPLTGGSWEDSMFMNHGWTLCYEEQFYAVAGIVLFLVPRHFFGALHVLSVAIAGLLAVSLVTPLPFTDGFFFDGRWLAFAAGVLVYQRLRVASARGARVIDVVLGTAAIAAVLVWRRNPTMLHEELVFGMAFALLLVFLFRFDLRLIASGALRPLARCGLMCYSLYLVHWPICLLLSHVLHWAGVRGAWPTLFVTVPICLAASLLVAWAFHVVVERRFLSAPPSLPPVRGSAQPCPVLSPARDAGPVHPTLVSPDGGNR